jgi:regulation of enolase protein 1 (concanavalin A-like superfamily)
LFQIEEDGGKFTKRKNRTLSLRRCWNPSVKGRDRHAEVPSPISWPHIIGEQFPGGVDFAVGHLVLSTAFSAKDKNGQRWEAEINSQKGRKLMRNLRCLFSVAMSLGCLGVAQAQVPGGFEGLPKMDGAWKMVHAEKGKAEMTGGALRIVPETGTNLILSPSRAYNVMNAPMVLADAQGDFTLVAKVSARLAGVYDSGALVVYSDEKNWAKVCFENSPQHEATIISVVTREWSDDVNHETLASPFVYLAVARKGNEFSFHFSRDGRDWRLVRHFDMPIGSRTRIGFTAQTPHMAFFAQAGEKAQFAAQFSEIRFVPTAPKDMRQLEAPAGQTNK